MCKQPICFLSDVAGGMSSVAAMHPQPALPPCSGARTGARAWNGTEMVTAGITDWAPASLLRAQGQPGLGRGPGLPEPQGGRWTQVFRRTQRTRRGTNSRRGGMAFLLPRSGEPPPRTRPRNLHPRTQHPLPYLAPTCSAWRVAKERGAAQEPPPWGQEQ